MIEPKATISVVIPHRDGRRHLDTCLTALRRQTYPSVEVILVDNGSTDGSQAYVRASFPEVQLIELGENRGFTGACNAGMRVSTGDIVCLLNNDTRADEHWLEEVAIAFAQHPEVGMVAPKLLLFDPSDHFHAAGDYYCINGLPGNRGVWQRDIGQFEEVEYVFSACGAASAYRREMLDDIGLLDERLFFSCEDIDLAWRANLRGWRALYVPSAVVYHRLKASGGSGAMSSYYDGRNVLYLLWKNYPGTLFRRYWRAILRAQLAVTRDAARAWRGEAARARLRGQLVGLVTGIRMLPTRRKVQRDRVIDDAALESRLTPVDACNRHR